MKSQDIHKVKNNLFHLNFSVAVLFCFALYGLAIFQDYLFSKIKLTGFYWTDTMLYNIYWLWFIPFTKIAQLSYHKINPKSLTHKIVYVVTSASTFSVLHIVLFTSIFIVGSHLMYAEPHRFQTILKSAISNQSQMTIIAYLVAPLIFEYLKKKKQTSTKKEESTLTIKDGTRRVKIETAAILCIQTNRPYTTLYLKNQKLLHDESLKKLETVLNPEIFLRVHRSAIINKHHVTELKSRKNGDYDGILSNGQTIRFSRHYRKNWNSLLNH
jgi:two-component system LytT family response regulator